MILRTPHVTRSRQRGARDGSRHRGGLITACVVAALALAAMLGPGTGRLTGPGRDVAASAGLPLYEAGTVARNAAGGALSALSDNTGAQAEIDRLREELAEAQLQEALLRAEVDALRTEADGRAPEILAGRESFSARVLGLVVDGKSRHLWVSADGRGFLRTGQPVLGPDGLIGAVREVQGDRALVQLLTDRDALWGAEATETRELGVLNGTGRADRLELVFEKTTTDVSVGHLAVTSGRRGSAAPGGLALGEIVALELDDAGRRVAVVEPAQGVEDLRRVLVLEEPRAPWEPAK